MMAIFHLSMKAISRSAGRSATAAAAYRAGSVIADERTGEIYDYRRKGGIESADIILPDGCAVMSRDNLWNGVELHHKRGDALVAREFEVALPGELSKAERQRLAVDFAREVTHRYRVAADVCIHEPGRGGDDRNYHAHILLSACAIHPDGFGKKVAELDPIHCQRHKIANPADLWRERWAEMTNERLRENGITSRVDHRTLEAQGIDREPTQHLGPAATGYERRTGEASAKRMQMATEVAVRLARAKKMGELERQINQLDNSILDLSNDLTKAIREREQQPRRMPELSLIRLRADQCTIDHAEKLGVVPNGNGIQMSGDRLLAANAEIRETPFQILRYLKSADLTKADGGMSIEAKIDLAAAGLIDGDGNLTQVARDFVMVSDDKLIHEREKSPEKMSFCRTSGERVREAEAEADKKSVRVRNVEERQEEISENNVKPEQQIIEVRSKEPQRPVRSRTKDFDIGF